MNQEYIAIFMFASMMLMLLSGQRVFGAIGAIAAIAALALWGTGGQDIPFSAALKAKSRSVLWISSASTTPTCRKPVARIATANELFGRAEWTARPTHPERTL